MVVVLAVLTGLTVWVSGAEVLSPKMGSPPIVSGERVVAGGQGGEGGSIGVRPGKGHGGLAAGVDVGDGQGGQALLEAHSPGQCPGARAVRGHDRRERHRLADRPRG